MDIRNLTTFVHVAELGNFFTGSRTIRILAAYDFGTDSPIRAGTGLPFI